MRDWPLSYFGFAGRLGLRTFWMRMVVAFLCAAPIFLLPTLLPRPVSNAAWRVTIVGAAMCQASLTWRRLNDHDLGTRMKLLLGVVPIAGLACVAVLFDAAAGWVPALEGVAITVGIVVLLLISPLWLSATSMLYIRPGSVGANQFGAAPV